ncbi:MAG: biotin--[acetyl-CoA-carboxylase] ligase [Flammeovirgaceae bacterium]|nr:biotin--[acetyl-CoA-carboxylase] ligase [Flammeovirgaceae bacterium]
MSIYLCRFLANNKLTLYKITANTIFLGKKSEYLPTCHSTNDVLTELVRNDIALQEGFLIHTAHQTHGRGQRGNRWESAPYQNLTFSFLLKPRFLLPSQSFQLNIAISVGLIDYLKKLCHGFQIKWSNDIYHDNKKLGGILIENEICSQRIEHSIVGIGLNVNQTTFSFSQASANQSVLPTSLALIKQQPLDLAQTLNDLLPFLEQRYLQLRSGKIEQLKHDYLQHLYWYQEEHLFEDLRVPQQPMRFSGQILGIDKEGRLCIASQEKLLYFEVKQIRFIH